MGYVLGIAVGDASTAWATATAGHPPLAVDGATIPSVVALAADGRIVVGESAAGAASDPSRLIIGFADRLGEATPVMVGGTPYGIESLIGHLVAAVVAAAIELHGVEPDAVALAHVDGLDDYRSGLLTEAARLAGVPIAKIIRVSYTDARRALTSPAIDTGIDLELACGAAFAALGAAAVSETATAAFATAPATVAGSAFPGTPMPMPGAAYPNAAYPGTPLPAPSVAYPGMPLATPGSGYSGTPLTMSPNELPASTGLLNKARPRWVPLVVGAATVALVAASTAIAMRDDGEGASRPTPSTVNVVNSVITSAPTPVTTQPVTTQPVTTVDSTTSTALATTTVIPTTTTTTTLTQSSAECIDGHWTIRNDGYWASVAAAATALGANMEVVEVSGLSIIAIGADGTFTQTFVDFEETSRDAASGFAVSTVLHGVATARVDIGDGTLALSGVVGDGTINVIANGVAMPAQPLVIADVADPTATFTCSDDQLELQYDYLPMPFELDRSL